MKKTYVLKNIIKKMLKDLEINKELTLNYGKDKSTKIKRVSQKTFLIDGKTMVFSNSTPIEIENRKTNIELNFKDLTNYIGFSSKFYLYLKDDEIEKLNKKYNQNIEKIEKKNDVFKDKNNIVEKINYQSYNKNNSEIIKNEYIKIQNLLKNFHKKVMEKTNIECEKYIKETKVLSATGYFLHTLLPLKNVRIWEIVSEVLTELNIENKQDGKVIALKLGFETYLISRAIIVDEDNDPDNFLSKSKIYYLTLLKSNENEKKYEESKKFFKFEKTSNVGNECKFKKLDKISTNVSCKNTYVSSKTGYETFLFETPFRYIFDDFVEKYNLDITKIQNKENKINPNNIEPTL